MTGGLSLGFSLSLTGNTGGGEKPIIIQPPTTLMSFANRATLLSPNAVFTETADSGDGLTMTLTGLTNGTVYTATMASWLTTPIDMSDKGVLQFDFLPQSYFENLNLLSIRLFSAGSAASPGSDYHQVDDTGLVPSGFKQISTAKLLNGGAGRRQTLGIPTGANLTAVGAGANLSAIKGVVMRFRSSTTAGGVTLSTKLGPLKYQPNPLDGPYAVIHFDDGYPVVYTDAFPQMQAYGWKGVIQPGALDLTIDQPGWLTSAQALEMVNAGWQWAYQAKSSEQIAVIDAMTDAQRDAEMTGQFDFATAHGLRPYRKYGSYFSQVNYTDMTAAHMFVDNLEACRNFLSARGGTPAIPLGESYPYGDHTNVRAVSASDSASANEWHADQAIANRGIANYVFHGDLTNLPALLTYLSAHNVKVVTQDYLARRYVVA